MVADMTLLKMVLISYSAFFICAFKSPFWKKEVDPFSEALVLSFFWLRYFRGL